MLKKILKIIYSRVRIINFLCRDVLNVFVLRSFDAPRSAQLIWVSTRSITNVLPQSTDELGRAVGYRVFMPRDIYTGRVIGGDWDLVTEELNSLHKFNCCVQHFGDKVPWDETDLYQLHLKRLQFDGFHPKGNSAQQILERYKALDDLYQDVKKKGRLSTQSEISKYGFREDGGIYIHIDRNGSPIFGGGGIHRLAIAKILNLEIVPAQLGVIHQEYWYKKREVPLYL